MVLGLVFRKIGVFDDAFTNRMNSFVFKFALPALLFEDLWEENFYQAWMVTLYFFVSVLLLAASLYLLLCRPF